MQPMDQMSTGVEYLREPISTSGARYHSVTTWSCFFAFDDGRGFVGGGQVMSIL